MFRYIWEDNIKAYFTKTGMRMWATFIWIRKRTSSGAVVNMVMNLRALQKARNFVIIISRKTPVYMIC
jgi:hypothetical protein